MERRPYPKPLAATVLAIGLLASAAQAETLPIVVQNRKVAALSGSVVPALVAASGIDAVMRFLDFFATRMENDNTRAA
jgi:hypothetical protein